MSLGGVLLGLINIAIWVVLFILIGLLILLFCRHVMGIELDARIQKMYMILVGLIALGMLVALLLGIPYYRFVGSNDPAPIGAVVQQPSTRILR